MVIKLQSILSPDFNHGVMVLECFLKMRPKRNRRHMAGSRHTNFWSDQTRPTTAPSDCSCKTGYYWRSMSRRRRRTHHSVEFFVWPHLPQSCYKAWEGATLQTQKWVQKWVALHQEDISRFLADYRLFTLHGLKHHKFQTLPPVCLLHTNWLQHTRTYLSFIEDCSKVDTERERKREMYQIWHCCCGWLILSLEQMMGKWPLLRRAKTIAWASPPTPPIWPFTSSSVYHIWQTEV